MSSPPRLNLRVFGTTGLAAAATSGLCSRVLFVPLFLPLLQGLLVGERLSRKGLLQDIFEAELDVVEDVVLHACEAMPGSPDYQVVVVLARMPPLGEVEGQLCVLLQHLGKVLSHDHLLPQLGQEVHPLQHLASLLL